MSWLIPRRRPCREMLDDLDLAPEEMARSLRDLELVNGKWGGSRALDRYLLPQIRAARHDHFALPARLRRAGARATVVGVDIQWRHLAAGRASGDPRPPALAADAFSLPLPA